MPKPVSAPSLSRKLGWVVLFASVLLTAAAGDGFAMSKKHSDAQPAAASPASSSDPLSMAKAAAEVAAKAGDAAALKKANGDIDALVSVLPAWVAEKQQAASVVAPDKQRIVGIWNKVHQQALADDAADNRDKALDAADRAASIAKDNLGEAHFATIISFSDLAGLQAKYGKTDAAEISYVKAVKAAEAAFGGAHPETLKIKNALSGFYGGQIRFSDALAVSLDAADAAAAAFGTDHPITFAQTLTVARIKLAQGSTKDAADQLGVLCGAERKRLGNWHPTLAQCLASDGAAILVLGDIDKAYASTSEAIAILSANGDAANSTGLAARIALASLEQKRGHLSESRKIYEDAAKDAQAANDHGQDISAKAGLTEVLQDLGDQDAAEALGKEVLDDRTKTLGPAHPDRLAALSAMGAIYRKQGRLAEAEQAFAEALEHYRKILGPDHPSTIIATNNLGEILEKEGIFDQAEPYLREASDSSRKTYGEANPTTLASFNNLALLYESQGVFDKAEPLYKAVIAVQSKGQGPRNAETVASVNNLAYLYMLQGDYPKAADMFAQVLAAWDKAYGPKHINTMKALNNLARAHFRMGKAADAEKEFDRALATRRQILGDRHMDVLRSQHDLAVLYAGTKRQEQAKALLLKTVASLEETLGKQHPYTFEAMNTLADVLTGMGDAEGAMKVRRAVFERRNAFLDRMLYVTGNNAREGYIRLYAPELNAFMAQLAKTGGEDGARGVAEVSLARKGLLLKVASELSQVGKLSRDPAMNKLTTELVATRKRLAALTLSGPTPETKGTHIQTLNELEDRIGILEGELGRASAKFRKTTEPAGLDKLEAALPKDGALVDFLIYGDEGKSTLIASVLTWEGDKPVYKLATYPDLSAINAAIQKYRTDIQNEEIELDDLQDSGQAVYNLVWLPLNAALGARTNVYVVPDGMLNILPISALVTKDGKYLIEKIDLHVLGSSRDLLPSAIPAAKGGYIIDAGPDYNTDAPTQQEEVEKAKHRSATFTTDQRGIDERGIAGDVRGMASGLRGLHFDPLPGAEREGQLIQKTVEGGGKSTVIFLKGDAQEKSLRELGEPPEILHIATHGFFLKADDNLRRRLLSLQRGSDAQLPPPGDNPLLRAGLAFAGINANAPVLGEIDTDNDGVLTALEVLSLNLTGTRLAILSACETGLGEIHEGEGVYGLRRAFQEAGVQSVVSSLWEVSDAGTQTLMSAVYKRLLAGETPHNALRDSQIEMLRKPEWSAPYIWSAFFMVGA